MRAHFPFQISLVAATALVAACSSPTGPRGAEQVFLAIEPSAVTLLTGREFRLNLTGRGADDRLPSSPAVVWSSTDDGVATVTADGVVTANRNGAAQIAAWWEGHRAFATVRVVDREPPPRCRTSEWESLETGLKRFLCPAASSTGRGMP